MGSARPPAKNGADLWALLRFVAVGILNTGVDYGGFLLLTAVGLPALPAHALSYTAGLLNSFFWNKFWTFRAAGRFSLGEIIRFVIVNLAALALSGGIMELGIRVFLLPDFIAKAAALPFSFAVNFIGNRLWVFPKKSLCAEKH
jgi:putative flippase GtrA